MKKGIIGLMLMACAMSACQKDAYDPNYNPNLGAHVPDNFEWSTTKTLNVNVEVKDDYNGKYYYSVRVYDKAPGKEVLPVAASSKVNKDFPFSQKIVVPATVTKLYIVQVFKKADASEVITQKEIATDGGNIACSFGNGSSAQKASTRGKDDWKELKEGMTIETQGLYYLKGAYTLGDINDKVKNVAITIRAGGALTFSKTVNLPSQWEIKIEHGGQLKADDKTTITLGNNSAIKNYGQVYVYDIVFDNGSTLYNGDDMEEENEGGCFHANNITLNSGHGGDKRYLGEKSYTSCNQLTLNKVKLTFKASAWLKCTSLSANGGACTLQGEGSTIGDTEYIGLATIGTIAGDLKIEDDILVECKNTSIEQPNVVDNATGKIQIIGTTCNGGGFDNNEKAKLGEYTYIFEDMYPNQGDYDMNDIVVSLTATLDDSNVLTIEGQLKAVGASYAITPYIKVNDTTKPLFENSGQASEAHAILGSVATSSLINTIEGGTSLPAQDFTLTFNNVKEGLNMDDIDLYIVVDGREIHWNTKVDKATWGMRIPGLDFKWAQERVKITEAYSKFTEWFTNPASDWYNSPKPDLIYQAQ